MNSYHEIIIIIPALNPTDSFLTLVHDLQSNGLHNILCINDGSSDDSFFKKSEQLNCEVITHSINLGKGRSLKDAFDHVLLNYPDAKAVITVDADGQHTIRSILDCVKTLQEQYNSDVLILGSRHFGNTEDIKIPMRSKFGNICTRTVLNYLCGIKVSDTQTGLRGIPTHILPKLITISGERYEYEMNMLLGCKEENIGFIEVPIETVYEDNNATSHFNPLRDSWKIYKTILLYSLSSILSVIIDYIAFMLLINMGLNIWYATYGGRACSSILNFTINRSIVFNADYNLIGQSIKYFLLVILSGTISAFLVSTAKTHISINIVLIKGIVDTTLYFFNYYIQKTLIFKKSK